MRHNWGRIMLFMLGAALFLNEPPTKADDAGTGDNNPTTPVEAYTVDLTILPNYARHTLTLAGKLEASDEDDCKAQVKALLPDHTLDPTYDTSCQFLVPQTGHVEALSGVANTYTISLPADNFAVAGDDSSTTITVFAADVTAIQNAEKPVKIHPDGHTWKINGPMQTLLVTVHPWKIDSEINIITLFGDNLREHLKADTLLSGKVTISNITNLDSYYRLVGRDRNPDVKLIPSDIAQVVLDYPFYQSTETYPGFNFFGPLYAGKNLSRETQFTARFTAHDLKKDDKDDSDSLTGTITLSVTGYQRVTLPPPDSTGYPCPSTVADDENAQARIPNAQLMTLCAWLGPQDSLTLRVPSGVIVETSAPPNEQTSDTLIYRGAGQFEIKIQYYPLALNILQQYLFLLRLFFDSFGVQIVAVLIAVFILQIIFVAIGQRLRKSKWAIHYRFLLLPPLILAVGLYLLYREPSNTALLYLSLIVLIPAVHLRKPDGAAIPWRDVPKLVPRRDIGMWLRKIPWRDLVVVVCILTVVWLLNFFALRGDGLAGQQQLQVRAPLLLLGLMVVVVAIYFLPGIEQADDAARQAEAERIRDLHRDRLPAYAAFFLVAATYEVLDQSLLSLLILIIAIFVLMGRQVKLTPPDDSQPEDPDKRWTRHLGNLLGNPVAFALIIGLAFLVIAAGMTSIGSLLFTLTTLIGSALLFASCYDFLPGKGVVKALAFSIPLWLIFVFGIGTSDRGLNLLANNDYIPAMRYALYFEQFPALLVGRIIFYLTVPLLVALYVEFKERQAIAAKEKKSLTLRDYLGEFHTQWTLFTAILSALVPTLYTLTTQQPTITTLVDVLGKLTNGG